MKSKEGSTDTRFVRNSDNSTNNFVFNLPETWWSRTYEYEWTKSFINPSDVTLDAACGLEHPLKYYLLDNTKKTYACDIDKRLTSKDDVLKAVKLAYGDSAAKEFPDKYFSEIEYDICSLSNMPYKDEQFDKVFCISVLEHLNDSFNKYKVLNKVPFLRTMLAHDIEDSLREFHRITKKGGLVILTFDFPRINLEYFHRLVSEIGFTYSGNFNFKLPNDAIYSKRNKLYCFRAVLEKS